MRSTSNLCAELTTETGRAGCFSQSGALLPPTSLFWQRLLQLSNLVLTWHEKNEWKNVDSINSNIFDRVEVQREVEEPPLGSQWQAPEKGRAVCIKVTARDYF